MTQDVIDKVKENNSGEYTSRDITVHYMYLQDNILGKITEKSLYTVEPNCLTHYWDLDGPTYCPKCPMSFKVLCLADLTLLREIRNVLYELHFKHPNIMKYANFFRMLPLIHLYH